MNNGISKRTERQTMGVYRTNIQTNGRKIRQQIKMEQKSFGERRIVPEQNRVLVEHTATRFSAVHNGFIVLP